MNTSTKVICVQSRFERDRAQCFTRCPRLQSIFTAGRLEMLATTSNERLLRLCREQCLQEAVAASVRFCGGVPLKTVNSGPAGTITLWARGPIRATTPAQHRSCI